MPMNQNKPKNQDLDYLVVLDFEAQCIDGKTLDCQEIIEFPAVIVDVKQKTMMDTFHYYIKPVVHPKLYPFCTELTGITQDKVEGAISLEEALGKLDEFLQKNKILGTSWCFVSCGNWDLQTCLRKECQFKNIQVRDYMRNWINLKEEYPVPATYKDKRAPDMVTMLELSKLELQGRHHSGIDDTKNIARVAIYLLENGFIFKRSSISNISYKYTPGKNQGFKGPVK